MSLRTTILSLTSPTLDADRALRQRCVAEAQACCSARLGGDNEDDDESGNERLSELAEVAIEAANECHTPASFERIASLLLSSLSSCTNGSTKTKLCHSLCRLLAKSCSVPLLERAAAECANHAEALASLISCDDDAGVIFTALSLSSATQSSKATAEDVIQQRQTFLQTALPPSSNNFPTPSQLSLAKLYLASLSSAEIWGEIVPSWGLKLRSHPDKVLPLLEILLECFANSVASSKADTGQEEQPQQQEQRKQLLEAVERQLKSTKKDMRVMASKCLISLARLGMAQDVSEHVADALSSLGSSELRLGAYAALEGVTSVLLQREDANQEGQMASSSQLADRVLSVLCTVLPKDKNSTDGAKEGGYASLLSWMHVSKRFGTSSGYEKSLDYFVEATDKYSSLKGEFRFRLGNLVVSPPPPSIDGGDLIRGEAFSESIIVDLFERKNTALAKGLESIIETAAKKFKTADTMPQTDGILATFLLVSYAHSKGQTFPPSVAKVLKEGSFFYGPSVMESVKTDPLLNYLVHRTIALHCKISCKEDVDESAKHALVRLTDTKAEQPAASAAARALAVCVANPLSICSQVTSYSSAFSSLKTVITYSPASAKSSNAMTLALVLYLNDCSLKNDDAKVLLNDSYETITAVDESLNKLPSSDIREPLSEDAFHKSIRGAANFLVSTASDPDALWKAILMTHAGTNAHSSRKQRVALVSHLLDALKDKVVPMAEQRGTEEMMNGFAGFIALCAAAPRLDYDVDQNDDSTGEKECTRLKNANVVGIGRSVHEAACSLISTLGGIAGSFDAEFDDADEEDKKPYSFASRLCTQSLPAHLVSFMNKFTKNIESLSEDDIALYRSPEGVLFRPKSENDVPQNGGASNSAPAAEKKKAAPRKAKGGGGGFDAMADEEWEKQVKRELAKKKEQASSSVSAGSLSPQDKELLAQQSSKREQYSSFIDVGFPRTLASICCLCESDIEVGNASLPLFGIAVIRAVVSPCVALTLLCDLQHESFNTLTVLAKCVYEIDEKHAPTLARALAISFRSVEGGEAKEGDKSDSNLIVHALPSICPSAACAIFEMDEYGDCLSGNSFAFLFPILRAALTGPRNITGCDSALTVLDRHFVMLAGDEVDPIVKPMRKEIAMTLLELLSHDRCQTFVNPTPYEALIGCYVTDDESSSAPLSAAEIAPLLGERGALGPDNNRIASMETFAAIAEVHPAFVRNNPLIENRIWLNCHDAHDRIKTAARKAWLLAHEHDVPEDVNSVPLDPPSKMYAVPLLPLLSHEDTAVASAAAASLARAMGMYSDSAEKNIVKICNSYIASFPAPANDEPPKSSPFPVHALPVAKKPVKKVIDTGLKKKPTTKKPSSVSTSLAKITGAPAPRKTAATKALIAKTAPKERTLDQDALMGQFVTQSSVKKDTAEADSDSKVAIRLGVLRAVSCLTEPSAKVQLNLHVLKILIGFLIAFGLGDRNADVRNSSRNAARDIVASFCSSKEVIAFFLPQFESVLKTGEADVACIDPLSPEKVPQTIEASDYRKEGVVILLGSIALHLNDDSDGEKIDGIIDMLLNALKTPSEDVQSSVALCLSKLAKKGNTQARIETLIDNLMKECIEGQSLALQRGAAYGISAIIKGSGIAALKKFDVVKRLEDACTSGTPSNKEGSLFAIELCCSRLGILFEPYVIVLLPALLKAFSDSNDHVRSAADKTVGLIMSNLSGHGVKLVMPAVLQAFDETEWRTRVASIKMLGNMSHCAPKQLASCLPRVVPKLTEAFSDTHPKVKKSAEQALEELCKVIKNPEISSISTTLLKALTDPANGTTRALEALISTEFLHSIDAPSLSVIIPVVHRGLRDRAASTKRYAALISGNICTMVNDARDFVPYLPILIPDLKSTLIDPIPDVRSISAKSLGSLTRGLGEATFPDLRPWLIETLTSEGGSSVERSGAAQGLTEILVASGAQLTEHVMRNEILPLKSHPKAGTREGVLWVLTFLPSTLGQGYSSLIDESLPALLSGLADDNETVREVALRAGRVLVRSNGKAHKDKILPALEEGLSNEDYRIRVSSLTLLGDLLSMLGGTKVSKGSGDTQDDIRQAERAQAQIALVLGNETRKRVLSSLYLSRSDTAAIVRQSAVQVWKTVVSVTPRTLREILSELVDQVVSSLASGDPDRTQVAGRCLGDIVQKLGDQVVPEIIPVLRDSLYRGDEYTRQGVCVGLAEVIACSSKEQIIKFLEILVKVVKDALCDDAQEVRKMAAECFQSLYQTVGARTLEEIVPSLLVGMESSDDAAKTRALNGMAGILSVRSRELLPFIIPRLLKSPISISHADGLSSISAVTSETIYLHFNAIIPTLISEVSSFHGVELSEKEKSREQSIRSCSRAVCHNVDGAGVNWLISEIASKCTNDKVSIRKESCWFFQIVIEERKETADFYEQLPIILRDLLHRLNDDSAVVLKSTHDALQALTTCVPAEELVTHLPFIRNLIASMVSEARYRKGGVGDGQFFLPGFNMAKGLEPLLPIYQRGILYGDAAVRETAAAGLGELISITADKFLAGPFLIKLTGPLLRIVGDRNPSTVKIAIIKTLGLILQKGGPALRAFVPQFQTTFVKALSDPSRQVRLEAINALALLMPLTTRVDPLIKELVSTSTGKGSNVAVEEAGMVAIQTATLEALAVVLRYGGSKVKLPESVPTSLEAGKELVVHEDEGIRESASKVIGYACELLGKDAANATIREMILDKGSSLGKSSIDVKHGTACIIRRLFSTSVGKEVDRSMYQNVLGMTQELMRDDSAVVRSAACAAIGAVLGSSTDIKSTLAVVEKSISNKMDPKEALEVQQAVASGLCITARLQPGLFRTKEALPLTNGALKLAMSGAQRVQFSYNDFLWLALDVQDGDGGLEEYLALAHFDQVKTMKPLYSKVLAKMKPVKDID
eukprot:CCRYP_016513-RD/>CCRYP_016513-RD protein AED:0.04 eAED:0.04 QI:135/1/1/1/0.77/0.7/10/4374/2912